MAQVLTAELHIIILYYNIMCVCVCVCVCVCAVV
jgi:hypothetical protein